MGKLTLQLKRGTRHSPFFDNLSFFEKRKVLKKGMVDWDKKGTRIFKQGKRGKEVFVILSGQVALVDENGPEPHRIALLKQGDVFGELAFASYLRGQKAEKNLSGNRLASAYANDEVKLFRFSEDDFKSLMEENPQCAAKLLLNLFFIATFWLRGSIMGKGLKTSDLGPKMGQGLTKDQMRIILTFGHVGSSTKGQTILSQGEAGKNLYMIMKGQVDIFLQHGEERRHHVTSKSGDLFGELAVGTGLPRLVTAVASEDCKLFSIDKKGLYNLLKKHPSLSNIFILNLLETELCRLKAVM